MANITSVLTEIRSFKPSKEFTASANIKSEIEYQTLCNKAATNYSLYWETLAKEHLSWFKDFTIGLNSNNAPFYQWFEDGLINASYNCVDRHLKNHANKIAISFESDAGEIETVTYQQLHTKVCQFANGLKSLKIAKGDRVVIYLPNSIEAIVAIQACARIGAIHSVIFGGFSAKSINERIKDAQAKLLITANCQVRGGKVYTLKNEIDEALLMPGSESVKHVIVQKRTSENCNWLGIRDIWWHELIKNQSEICEPERVEAEHPLFILYTSGSTGKPKGVVHSTAGYLLGAVLTMKWVFDIKPHDKYWCTADVGWITGHTYIAYGPLAAGSSQIIFEGIPTYPNNERFWQIIQKHKVTIFYTAPTAIRSLIKSGVDLPKKYDLSSLRLLGTVGEPINPEAWMWFYEVVGNKKCPIVDTWWQTETGCNILAAMPGITELIPGSCTRPIPGISIDIVDELGNSIKNNDGGFLVITKPFPSQIRTIWNDNLRFIDAYYPADMANGKYYITGDSAHRDKQGNFWILGRIDDVLNVSGHRLGTMEIEAALAAHPVVAEAAVIGKPHEIKGESIIAFIVCKNSSLADKVELSNELKVWVTKQIGAIARPDEIRFGSSLPKTRSGKIMRRLLRNIAKNEPISQDISTLENPADLAQLQIKIE